MQDLPDSETQHPFILIQSIYFPDDELVVISMEEADAFLREKAKTIPISGFTKVVYSITWENGKWYRGFYPLYFSSRTEKLLSVHLAVELLNKAGVVKPMRLTMDAWIKQLEEKNKKYPTYSEFAKKVFLYYERN